MSKLVIRISLLSCNPKQLEVGVDGFPPLPGTHMRETKYAVTGGCEIYGFIPFTGNGPFLIHETSVGCSMNQKLRTGCAARGTVSSRKRHRSRA